MEKMLIVPEKENVFLKFFKWICKAFQRNKEIEKLEEVYVESNSKIMIPKNVKIPERAEKKQPIDVNSLEYLYHLTDEELEQLEAGYDKQIEKAKQEVLRLEEILQTYKKTIKRFQEDI